MTPVFAHEATLSHYHHYVGICTWGIDSARHLPNHIGGTKKMHPGTSKKRNQRGENMQPEGSKYATQKKMKKVQKKCKKCKFMQLAYQSQKK